MDTGTYSVTITSAQLGKRGKACPALFENRKKYLDFGKKGPDSVHHWVKLSIQNVVLRVSRRVSSDTFRITLEYSTLCF